MNRMSDYLKDRYNYWIKFRMWMFFNIDPIIRKEEREIRKAENAKLWSALLDWIDGDD